MQRLIWAKRTAWIASLVVLCILALALIFWREAVAFVSTNDALFKLIGLGIGPVLALLGFFWGLVDKAEIKSITKELGRAEKAAESARVRAEEAKTEVAEKIQHIKSLEHDLTTIADAGRLWKLRPNDPFPEYKGWKYDPEGAKIVTVALFKGGVGKTHLAANFAAYVSEKRQLPVLLVDLDFQGSLSTVMLYAAGIEPAGSKADGLFSESADLATLSESRFHLTNHGDDAALNGGRGLARAWIVPSDYSLAQVESRLLIERAIHNRKGLDERYRLAHLLLHPSVRREYALILIDTPPRMTLGTVNALVASHSIVVPAILDRVSSEAVGPFLSQVELLKHDLALDLRLAGIVGTMTRSLSLSPTEQRYRDRMIEAAEEALGRKGDYMVQQNLPRKSQVTNMDDLGYFLADNVGPLRNRFYDAIFDDLWQRIMAR